MADNFVVKKLTHEYVDDVLFIEKELLGSGLKEDIEKTISSDVLDYYLLFLNEKVIGFFEVSNVAGESELFDIAIKKEFQGLGYSKILMEHLLTVCREKKSRTIFLEVNKINLRAIKLYEKFGFKEYAVRKNYYGENDAVLMKLEDF